MNKMQRAKQLAHYKTGRLRLYNALNKHDKREKQRASIGNIVDNDVNFSYPESYLSRPMFPIGVASEEDLAEYIKDQTVNYTYPEQFPTALFGDGASAE